MSAYDAAAARLVGPLFVLLFSLAWTWLLRVLQLGLGFEKEEKEKKEKKEEKEEKEGGKKGGGGFSVYTEKRGVGGGGRFAKRR
jgi:hypothetical protein